jgi:hypothetical protein
MGLIINNIDTEMMRHSFASSLPFHHVVLDNFFTQEVAERIVAEFPAHDDSAWTVSYDNPVEKKKACSHWDKFPASIYNAIFYLCSKDFEKIVTEITGNEKVYADYGLHGGGMHSHCNGGMLNIHKDYSIHPKLKLMRNYNLIVYMTPDWDPSWGGGLELWSHNEETNQPKECVTKVENKFNRAILFDTTKNSWHGLPEKLVCPENVSRRSLATYYVSEVSELAEKRNRAVFAPYKEQANDPELIEFVKKRSGEM